MNQKAPQNLSAKDLQDWLLKKTTRPLLIDVREDNELEIAPFPNDVLHIPLSKLEILKQELDENLSAHTAVVVICHAGIRSWNFGAWLISQNFDCQVWNLVGGIDAWSREVDSSVPRY